VLELLAQAADPQQAADPGLQLGGQDGLAQEVVGAGPHGLAVAHRTVVGGDDQHRDVIGLRVAPQLPADLQAVGVGQEQVQDHQVGQGPGQLDLGLLDAGRDAHLVAVGGQGGAHELQGGGDILHDQDGGPVVGAPVGSGFSARGLHVGASPMGLAACVVSTASHAGAVGGTAYFFLFGWTFWRSASAFSVALDSTTMEIRRLVGSLGSLPSRGWVSA